MNSWSYNTKSGNRKRKISSIINKWGDIARISQTLSYFLQVILWKSILLSGSGIYGRYRWCLKLSLLFRATISWLISYVVTKKFLGLNWKIWNEHLIKHVSNCMSSQLYFIRANMNLRVYCNITSSRKVNYSLLKSVNNKLLSWSFIWVISEKAILYFESVEQ